jgi:glycogen debranching enzyme
MDEREHPAVEIAFEDVIRVKDQFYISATSSRVDNRTRVLKQGETFALFDRYGDIEPVGLKELGIYHEGTRFISRLALRLGKDRPLLLSSTVKSDNAQLVVDLTNPDIYLDDQMMITRGALHIFRCKFLWMGVCYERLRILNYGLVRLEISFSFRFEADFHDIFEVRGVKRGARGKRLEDFVDDRGIILSYRGLDGVIRRTRIEWSPKPAKASPYEAFFDVDLQPKEEATFFLTLSCESSGTRAPVLFYNEALSAAASARASDRAQNCEIYTSNEQFNDWINRSLADLCMMITKTSYGPYPYAGVPWFSTVFGRDGIITAFQMLWMNPAIARGVLAYLAATQATDYNPDQDAQPGKILHETRKGEMAALGEIPFGRYYGTADATPLFVLLAGAYYERTADRDFVRSIWPNIELALKWIDTDGDPDGDGFVEYARHSSKGLVHQGWKDSQDSVFHADGTLAEAPIALCEVQGYVYAAKRSAADLASMLGHAEAAAKLRRESGDLRERFERAFWCEELSTYALALDGKKHPCRVRTSNPGQCLFSGIATDEHARRIASTLLMEESFSGWGVRTVATSELRYNPMSYHNGSVWPHDNSLIAYGLTRYGLKQEVAKILTGLFDASLFVDLHALPELFCGFRRRPDIGPTLYPVACVPQSWASASVFLLVQACLGLSIQGQESQISFSYPVLPEFLSQVRIKNLRVGTASVDLRVLRHPEDVAIHVERRQGDVKIVVVK